MNVVKDNIIYHNVDEIEETQIGTKLFRYKSGVAKKMNNSAKKAAECSCGCELRFLTESPQISLTIYSEDSYGTILVYKGNNMHSSYRVSSVGFMNIIINTSECYDNTKELDSGRFDKDVWRIYFHILRVRIVDIHTLGYEITMPSKNQLPQKTLLSYGSSISHGMSSDSHSNCYAQTFARLSNMDCLIKGLSGSCRAEIEIAESFAFRSDWDTALLEIGVNMIEVFSTEQFNNRYNNFIDKMVSCGKKIILLTMFPCFYSFENNNYYDKFLKFNDIIRKKASELSPKQCLLVEGLDVMKSTKYLMTDLIHPTTEGHIMMGINLHNEVENFLCE